MFVYLLISFLPFSFMFSLFFFFFFDTMCFFFFFFFFQAEDGIRDFHVTGVQTCALPISRWGDFAAAFLSLLAGFFPSIYVALDMDMRHAEIARSATEFTNLRDRFRQAARIKSHAGRSEERRVGKECRSRWSQYDERKK